MYYQIETANEHEIVIQGECSVQQGFDMDRLIGEFDLLAFMYRQFHFPGRETSMTGVLVPTALLPDICHFTYGIQRRHFDWVMIHFRARGFFVPDQINVDYARLIEAERLEREYIEHQRRQRAELERRQFEQELARNDFDDMMGYIRRHVLRRGG